MHNPLRYFNSSPEVIRLTVRTLCGIGGRQPLRRSDFHVQYSRRRCQSKSA